MADRIHGQFCVFSAIFPLLLGVAFTASGQVNPTQPTSEVKLIVVDPAGAVIPHAKVTFKGQGTLATQETLEDGSIRQALSYGHYAVTIARSGFKSETIADLVVDAPNPTVKYVTLQLGQYTDDNPGVDLGVSVATSELPNAITSRPPAFTDDGLCPTMVGSMPFRVAYAHHFIESGVNVLSLRVSVGKQHGRTKDILCRVGTSVATKYRNEQSWQLLIFSDYEIAKNYKGTDSEHDEPPAYIGACMSIPDAGKAQVRCGRW